MSAHSSDCTQIGTLLKNLIIGNQIQNCSISALSDLGYTRCLLFFWLKVLWNRSYQLKNLAEKFTVHKIGQYNFLGVCPFCRPVHPMASSGNLNVYGLKTSRTHFYRIRTSIKFLSVSKFAELIFSIFSAISWSKTNLILPKKFLTQIKCLHVNFSVMFLYLTDSSVYKDTIFWEFVLVDRCTCKLTP